MSETREETTAPQEPHVDFWDCAADQELLTWTDIEEAVQMWADAQIPNPLPETVTVYGFARLVVSERDAEYAAEDVLERVLDRLDEDYGDPEEATKPTEAMKAAAREFAGKIVAEYRVWRCRQVTQQVERVAEYVPAEWMQPTPTEDTRDE